MMRKKDHDDMLRLQTVDLDPRVLRELQETKDRITQALRRLKFLEQELAIYREE